jgi:ubiquinone/menaquinone biosynthesis C-methylase UbiE
MMKDQPSTPPLVSQKSVMNEKRFDGDIARLRSPERVERLEVARVVSLCLQNGQVENVLDVGTGTGLFAEAFVGHELKVSGLDVNSEMLAAARQFVPQGDFRAGTVEELPFPDDAFDLVFLGLVLHESDDVLQTLKEALRVAREKVCILEWPYQNQSFGPSLAHRLNPNNLARMFREVGFRRWKMMELANTVLYCLEVQT